MQIKRLLVLLIPLFFIAACSTPEERFENQLDKIMDEDIAYTEYYNDGFSVKYPVWPTSENDNEISVTKGYCSVTINTEEISADMWYQMIVDSVNKQKGKIIEEDENKNYLRYSMPYQNFIMVSENRIFGCNNKGNAVTVTCIEQAYEKSKTMRNTIYDSAKCNGEENIEKSETEYETYSNGDFIIDYPKWDKLQDNSEHQLAVSKGVCSVLVDKYNALPEDIYSWYTSSLKKDNILDKSNKNNIYYITYTMSYEDKIVTSKAKILYCNYESYITQVLCVDDFLTEEYEEIRTNIIDSSLCKRKYEAITQEELKEKAEEESPEIVNEIEDEIVKTNVGEEFGINEEAVVYFINNNLFFNKIMKDFPKANIVIEDKENNKELDLKVTIDENGKIKLLEDGSFGDADITLIAPLRDALNIFGNAQNINPITLIGFAANVRTDPPEIKNEVIQKVINGYYN